MTALTGSRAARSRWWPAGAITLGISVQLALLAVLTRGMWFTLDALHYFTQRGIVPGADEGLLAPWGGHWQTIPVLVYRVQFEIFGMRHYLPYVLVSMLLHAAICILIYLLLRRSDVSGGVAAVTTWLVIFCGVGVEAFATDPPMALTSALALGLAAAYVCLRWDYSRKALAGAGGLLVLAMMCSGTAITAAAFVGVFLTCRRNLVTGLKVVAPGLLLFTLWFVVVGRDAGRVHATGWELTQVPRFAWTGLSGAVEGASGIPGSGPTLILVLLVVAFAGRSIPTPLRHLAWAGIIAAVTQITLSGVGGYSLSDEVARTGRYAYIVFVCLAPALAICVTVLLNVSRTALRDGPLVGSTVAALLLGGYTLNALSLEKEQTASQIAFMQQYRSWVLGSVASVDADEKILTPRLPGFNGPLDARLVTSPEIRRALPSDKASAEDRLTAEGDFFVGVGSASTACSR